MGYEVDFFDDDFFGDEGSAFLDQPGIYHMMLTDVKENEGPRGTFINGFLVKMKVIAGTNPSQVGKTFDTVLFDPKTNAKDGGQFARKKQMRFFFAADLIDPNVRQSSSVELSDAVNRTICCKISKNRRSEKDLMDIDGLKIWHVDDPAAADIPKCQATLEATAANLRHASEWFKWSEKNGKAATRKPEPATAGAGTSDLDCL